jgi:hypothetical protein
MEWWVLLKRERGREMERGRGRERERRTGIICRQWYAWKGYRNENVSTSEIASCRGEGKVLDVRKWDVERGRERPRYNGDKEMDRNRDRECQGPIYTEERDRQKQREREDPINIEGGEIEQKSGEEISMVMRKASCKHSHT